jgi:hypothetical protein
MCRLFLFCIMIALAPHALHYIALAHVCSNALDHVELKHEEPMEQAQAKDLTSLALDQGKP